MRRYNCAFVQFFELTNKLTNYQKQIFQELSVDGALIFKGLLSEYDKSGLNSSVSVQWIVTRFCRDGNETSVPITARMS